MFSIQNKQILSIEILIFLVISVCPLSSLAPSPWKIGDGIAPIGEQRDKDDEQFKELLTVDLENHNLHIDLESLSQGIVLHGSETTPYAEIKTKLKEEWGRVVDFSVYIALKRCILIGFRNFFSDFLNQFVYFRMPDQTWFRTKIYQNRIFRPLALIIFPILIIQSVIFYLFRMISAILFLLFWISGIVLDVFIVRPLAFVMRHLIGYENPRITVVEFLSGKDTHISMNELPSYCLFCIVWLPLLAILVLIMGTIVLLFSSIIALFVTIYSFIYIIIYWFISLFRSTTKKNSFSQSQGNILDRLIANHDFKNSKSIKAFLELSFIPYASPKKNLYIIDDVNTIEKIREEINIFVSQKMLLNSDINADFLIDQFVGFFQIFLQNPEGKIQTTQLIELLRRLSKDLNRRKEISKKIPQQSQFLDQDILRIQVLHNLLLTLYNQQLYNEKHKGSNRDILLIKDVDLKKKMDSFPWIDALKKAA